MKRSPGPEPTRPLPFHAEPFRLRARLTFDAARKAPIIDRIWCANGPGMNYLMLAIAIVAEVCATTAMKKSDGLTRMPWTVATVIGYGIAFYFLSLTLRTIPTGIAYAIWSGVGIVLISTAAWLFQGQKLDAAAGIGMGLIVTGVVVMNVFSKASAH